MIKTRYLGNSADATNRHRDIDQSTRGGPWHTLNVPQLLSLIRRLEDRDTLQQFLAPFGTVADVDETDGLRARIQNCEIIHLGPSGNAPELRCYSERRKTIPERRRS